MKRFFLGAHHPSWLWDEAASFPLFVSHRSLARMKSYRPATCSWALDSGGFTELSMYGEWRTTPAEYVAAVARYAAEVGRLVFASPMDWMCEPFMVAKTGLTVAEHQRRTVANFLELCELWATVSDRPCPFVPVLQGWTMGDYVRCAELYEAAGVDLEAAPTVGLGSVCRRQNTIRIGLIVDLLSHYRLHGFGVKTSGLCSYGAQLASSDSLAWSYDARRSQPLPGCPHRSCSNCLTYARWWRTDLLDRLDAAS